MATSRKPNQFQGGIEVSKSGDFSLGGDRLEDAIDELPLSDRVDALESTLRQLLLLLLDEGVDAVENLLDDEDGDDLDDEDDAEDDDYGD